MANVLLENVSKQFPDGTVAVDNVSLEINDREFLVLVGPSGCGKSTTLRLIAGLETNTSGAVKIGDRDVTNVAPKDRDIAMVFQNYALYPHLSVYKNMSFGLSLRSGIGLFDGGVLARGLKKIFQSQRVTEPALTRDEIDNRVRQTADRLGIAKLLDRKPHQLSGGECQRVALGRAIVRNPAAFLLDEPLSNLDASLRQKMRVELKRLHRELQATIVYVTHDQVEAMTLGDRVAVMNEGRVLQIGKPLEIYQRPANLFVAKLIGSLPVNLCRGTVTQTGGQIRFDHQLKNGIEIQWAEDALLCKALKKRCKSSGSPLKVVLGFRAEDVRVLVKDDTSDQSDSFEVNVTEIDHLGESTVIHTGFDGTALGDNLRSGDPSGQSNSREILVRQDADTNLQVGDRVSLFVDPKRVLWFDPETGENLRKE